MKINLSKREKSLIYFLTILLIIFIYQSFIRSDMVADIHSLEEEIKAQGTHLESLKELESNQVSPEDLLLIEHGFNVSEANTEHLGHIKAARQVAIQKQSYEDLDIYEKEFIYATTNNIYNLIDFLQINKDKLHLKNLSLQRVDQNNFDMAISLSAYTVEEMPYSGIVKNYSIEDQSNQSLLNLIYGQEANEDLEYENNNSESKDKTSESSSEGKKQVRSLARPKSSSGQASIKGEDSKKDEKDLALSQNDPIDQNTQASEKLGTIITWLDNGGNQASISSSKNGFLPRSYFKKNKDLILKNSQILDYFFIENNNLIISINGLADFLPCPLIIEKPMDLMSLDHYIEPGDGIKISLLGKGAREMEIIIYSPGDFWDQYNFSLPKDENIYPILVEKIESLHGSKAYIRNFIDYEN